MLVLIEWLALAEEERLQAFPVFNAGFQWISYRSVVCSSKGQHRHAIIHV
jgi:hypothetical protein